MKLSSLGVASYGISITTLEEVFLAVGDGRDIGDHAKERMKVRRKIQKASQAGQITDNEEDEDGHGLLGRDQLTKRELK